MSTVHYQEIRDTAIFTRFARDPHGHTVIVFFVLARTSHEIFGGYVSSDRGIGSLYAVIGDEWVIARANHHNA